MFIDDKQPQKKFRRRRLRRWRPTNSVVTLHTPLHATTTPPLHHQVGLHHLPPHSPYVCLCHTTFPSASPCLRSGQMGETGARLNSANDNITYLPVFAHAAVSVIAARAVFRHDKRYLGAHLACAFSPFEQHSSLLPTASPHWATCCALASPYSTYRSS